MHINETRKNIVLLGAGFTTDNMGVWALASGAVTAALHAFPEAQVSFFDYHRTPMRYEVNHPAGQATVGLVNIRFSKKIWLPNNIARLLMTAMLAAVIPSPALKRRLLSRNPWLAHLLKADVIGSIAGGDSFSDVYGLNRLVYVALPQFLVLLLGRPLVLMPQTVGPFEGTIGKTIARYILDRADRVYCRDHDSLAAARNLVRKGNGRLRFCYDVGFVLEPRISENRLPTFMIEPNEEPLIGFNVSGLLLAGGYTKDNMFGLKDDYRHVVHHLIDHFIERYKAHIILFPHVFGGMENGESDVAACREIVGESRHAGSGRLHFIDESYDHHELKAMIGRCEFFMGSRMHACIGALSQSVPAAGLAYSRKFYGVYQSIGVAKLVIDLRKHDAFSVVRLAEKAYVGRSALHDQLKSKIPEVRDVVLGLLRH